VDRPILPGVFTRPEGIDDATVAEALRDGWAFDAASVAYLPVGFGSHHWVAQAANEERRFLTVDDLAARYFLGDNPATAFDALASAFATARTLGDAGLGWVVGPSVGVDGRVLRWLQEPFSIAVFPYVDGSSAAEYDTETERREVIALLGELHRSTGRVAAIARRETFALPNRADLEIALAEVGLSWAGGPYAEPARTLLAQHVNSVRGRLANYDRLVRTALRDQSGWTITHGEPHSGNLLRTDAGLRLIDWDTALVAPPERDLWMLLDAGSADAEHYTGATGRPIDPDVLCLYARWWDLCEIGIYLAGFRAPHDDSTDSAVAWRGLQHAIRGSAPGR